MKNIKKGLPAGKRGKFIVLYGTNNLGKTTQAKMLVLRLKKSGKKAEYVKYPVYDLEPAGGLINSYLRKGNPYKFTSRELQFLHFIDRIKFEPILNAKLDKGINVIAEDYFGTAVCWGVGCRVNRKLLEYFYSFVKKEDLAILFDGKRFEQSIEKNHRNENDRELIDKVRSIHLQIGKKYNWEKINANLSIKEVHDIIWDKVKKVI